MAETKNTPEEKASEKKPDTEPKKDETAPASAPEETAQKPDSEPKKDDKPDAAVQEDTEVEPRWETVKKNVYGREVVELHQIGFVGPGFEFNLNDLPEIRSLLKKLS